MEAGSRPRAECHGWESSESGGDGQQLPYLPGIVGVVTPTLDDAGSGCEF